MWYDDGLCLDLHQEMFYPPLFKEDRLLPESAYYRMGKFVCENCPIKDECLDRGQEEEFGLWGGHTPKERRTGRSTLNKTLLPKEKVVFMPKRSDAPLDLEQAIADIKPHLKRRSRKPK